MDTTTEEATNTIQEYDLLPPTTDGSPSSITNSSQRKIPAARLSTNGEKADDDVAIPPHVLQKMVQATDRAYTLMVVAGMTYLAGVQCMLFQLMDPAQAWMGFWLFGCALSCLSFTYFLNVMNDLYRDLEPLRALIRSVVGGAGLWMFLRQPGHVVRSWVNLSTVQQQHHVKEDFNELLKELGRCVCC